MWEASSSSCWATLGVAMWQKFRKSTKHWVFHKILMSQISWEGLHCTWQQAEAIGKSCVCFATRAPCQDLFVLAFWKFLINFNCWFKSKSLSHVVLVDFQWFSYISSFDHSETLRCISSERVRMCSLKPRCFIGQNMHTTSKDSLVRCSQAWSF